MADRTLEPLGISAEEEAVYRTLLRRGGGTIRLLAHTTRLSPARTRVALENLEAKGLASRSPGTRRHVPAPPDMALEALILARQQDLQRSRSVVTALAQEFRSAVERAPQDVVEMVPGDAIRQRFEQLQRAATAEVVVIDKPPYASQIAGPNPIEMDLLERGLRYRVLYDREVMSLPGRTEWIHLLATAGEQARITTGAPLKLAIADEKLGLVPLSVRAKEITSGLLVHESSLLVALIALFDALWDRAVPITATGPAADSPASPLSEQDRRLLALLLAGVPDTVISRELGVGARTVTRRIAGLMNLLGATTRFQAGAQAARRGWI